MGVKRCGISSCRLCPFLICCSRWYSTDRRVSLDIYKDYNCTTPKIFYIAFCVKCSFLKVLYTTLSLNTKFQNALKRSKNIHECTDLLSRHIGQCGKANIRLFPICRLRKNPNTNTLKAASIIENITKSNWELVRYDLECNRQFKLFVQEVEFNRIFQFSLHLVHLNISGFEKRDIPARGEPSERRSVLFSNIPFEKDYESIVNQNRKLVEQNKKFFSEFKKMEHQLRGLRSDVRALKLDFQFKVQRLEASFTKENRYEFRIGGWSENLFMVEPGGSSVKKGMTSTKRNKYPVSKKVMPVKPNTSAGSDHDKGGEEDNATSVSGGRVFSETVAVLDIDECSKSSSSSSSTDTEISSPNRESFDSRENSPLVSYRPLENNSNALSSFENQSVEHIIPQQKGRKRLGSDHLEEVQRQKYRREFSPSPSRDYSSPESTRYHQIFPQEQYDLQDERSPSASSIDDWLSSTSNFTSPPRGEDLD